MHHLYLTLASYIIVSCGALECKAHLFLSFILNCTGRPTASSNCCPSFRFSLSLQSGVENYFQLCLSGSTDVCNVFHLLFIISFHILSGFTLKKCYLADVSVCFWMLLGGFKKLFLLFLSAKRESSRLLQAFCSTQSHCPDIPEWKTVFV